MKFDIKKLCFLISFTLLFYSGYRAFHLSFTHDESFNYLNGVHYSFMEIVSHNIPNTSTNNHIINTLLMKFFDFVFGNEVFVLRIQSLLAHCIYMLFTFLLLKDIRSKMLLFCGFLLLNLNPYFFDFFSLARGYSLASSFMLMSIYFLVKYIKTDEQNKLWSSMIFGSLAVLSNFALLNYFASMLLLIELSLLIKNYSPDGNWKKIMFQKNKPVLITFLLLVIICFEPIRKIIKFKALFFGGDKGFWEDTVGSLVQKYTYGQIYSFDVVSIILTLIIIIYLSHLLLFIYRSLKSNFLKEGNTGFIILFLLSTMVFVSVSQNLLLGTMFAMERFALYFFPVFMISLIYFFDELFELNKIIKSMTLVFILVCSTLYSYHFVRTINGTYCDDWKYDADTENMLVDLETLIKKEQIQKVDLGISWYFEPTINFYREQKQLIWLNPVDREGPIGEKDFYFVGIEALDPLIQMKKVIIRDYPVSGGALLK